MKLCCLLLVSLLLVARLDAQPRLPRFELTKSGVEFRSIVFNPDSRLLAAGDTKGNIYLWDVNARSVVNTFPGKQGDIIAMAFSPDGRFLATAGKNNVITIWSAREGIELKRLAGHRATILDLHFSPDGKLLASASADGSALVWNFVEGTQQQAITEHTKEVSNAAFSPDGKLLATAGYDGIIFFWNTHTWKLDKKIDRSNDRIGRITALSFSPDGKFVAVGTERKGIQLNEVYTSYLSNSYDLHKTVVNELQFSPDGAFILSGGLDNTVQLVATETGKPVLGLSSFYHFSALSVSSNGKWLAVADVESKIKLFDLSELKIKAQSPAIPSVTLPIAGEITIEILEPNVPMDCVYYAPSNRLMLRGRVLAKYGVADFRINNEPIQLLDNGFFQHEVLIPMERWFIPMVAKDFNNQKIERKFVTQRGTTDASMGRGGRDYALIIATDQYDELEQLNNPVFDATTIQKDIEEIYGFETHVLKNATKREVLTEIRNYAKRQYARGDQLFIFVAGHGDFDAVTKQGYIAARDSRKGDDIKESYISHALFREQVDNIGCRNILLVLDVCFGGAINPVVAARGGENENEMERLRFIGKKLTYAARRLITSGERTYVSDGVKGEHSPFARGFIESLRSRGGKDGILTFSEIIPFIEKLPKQPTWGEFGTNEPGGDFLFVTKIN